MTKIKVLECLHRGDFLRAALNVGQLQNPLYDDKQDLETIMGLAAKVWHRVRSHRKDPVYKAKMINTILYERFGLQKTQKEFKQIIDDPARYHLHQVLSKKIGSPLTCALLYMAIADQVGLELKCIAIPGSFLLRCQDISNGFYIDPYAKGKFLNEADFHRKLKTSFQKAKIGATSLYERLGQRQLISKLILQLKHIYILKGLAVEALRAVEILSFLFPNNPELTRDRGILYCEMEYFSRAVEDLKNYVRTRPKADDKQEIKKLASMLKGCRETIN